MKRSSPVQVLHSKICSGKPAELRDLVSTGILHYILSLDAVTHVLFNYPVMSSIETRGQVPEFSPPYIAFGKDRPKEIELNGYKVYDYISPTTMARVIRDFAWHINLDRFDAILINQIGGGYFAREIAKIQNYKKPMIDIEYHRDGRVVTPIPKELYYAKVGIAEDILDTGGTAQRMLKDAPHATILFLTQKIGINNQIPIENKRVALRIDDVWVGGCDLNLEDDGDGLPKNFARDYKGIVVKILK